MKRNKKQQQKYISTRAYRKFRKRNRGLKRKNDGNSNRKFTNKTLPVHHEVILYIKDKFQIRENFKYINETVTLVIPSHFSLSKNPKESYSLIKELFEILFNQSHNKIILDYKDCEKLDLDAQVFADIILKYFVSYYKKLSHRGYSSRVSKIDGANVTDPDMLKVLYSVGSVAILKNKSLKFSNVVSYGLCIGNRQKPNSAEQQEIDTTTLVDYVIDSLKRVGKKLSSRSRRDLCQVIGEVLINAEEHSTTNYRYSIGYFLDYKDQTDHYGVFNLVILNFGETIYEKFKSPDCPTQHIVERMRELSSKYTSANWFMKSFNEETLWTLYSLQEGVTSKDNYRKRGNGSIRFIESFLNLNKSAVPISDNHDSELVMLSGNSKIVFDGTYQTSEKTKGSDKFRVMTFNESGDIEQMPDKNKVSHVEMALKNRTEKFDNFTVQWKNKNQLSGSTASMMHHLNPMQLAS